MKLEGLNKTTISDYFLPQFTGNFWGESTGESPYKRVSDTEMVSAFVHMHNIVCLPIFLYIYIYI